MHPIAIELGPLTIHWYGIFIALAFIAGVWTASRRGLRDGINPEWISDLAVWLLLGGIVGARLLHVITYWESDFANRPLWEVFAIWKGGLVFYGSLIGAALAGATFVKIKKLPFLKLADALAPSIALGSVFGRIGCLMTGCCFGKTCSLPWAIQFPPDSLAAGAHERLQLIAKHAPSLHVHPTQLYDSLLNLVLYIGLAWLYRRKKFDGQVFGVFLIAYAVMRSVVELFRGDYGTHQLGAFTPAQLVSVVILGAGIAMLVWLPRNAKPQNHPQS